MKINLKTLMALAMMSAMGVFIGCTPEEGKEPEGGDPTESGIENVGTHYAFRYQNNVVAPLDTLVYDVTLQDRNNGKADVVLMIENVTDAALYSTQDVALIEGPSRLAHPEVCGNGDCPWDGRPYDINPGVHPEPLAIGILEPGSVDAGTRAVYRVAVGEHPNFDNATVIYLRINF